ncbi:MAG: ARPP-1 family domain-containing protein [Pyrinomonadaceae bacterium]
MKRRTLALLIAIVTFTVGVLLAKLALPQKQPTAPPVRHESAVSNYFLSDPFSYQNLTILLIHGPDQPNSKLFVPLQEAMESKFVVVHETSDVNELAIENLSPRDEVFVQAGDIVKGGQQDRVLAVDLIMPTRSRKAPIDAFCVEHGRWQQRAAEPAEQFGSSAGMVATKELKKAAKESRSQAKVWDEVDVAQRSLSRSVETDVRSSVSRSSLQLAIENEKVTESAAVYTRKLSSIVEAKSDVLGYVFAINGKLNSADVYASSALFKRFWPKLLRTTAIEAVAKRPLNEKKETVSAGAITAFFVDAERGQESTSEITERTHMIKRESEKGLFFETRDMVQAGAWVHRSYLVK